MTLRNVLIAVGLMVVLAVAFYFAIWSPLDEQEVALVEETAALDSQAQQLRNQLTQLQEIRDNELEIRADLNRLRALLPSGDPAQPSFVRSVQLAADASGTAIESLTFGLPTIVADAPGAGPDGLVLAEIAVNAVVEGGYFQAVDLFRRLEVEVVRAVQVDDVGITEGTDGFPQLSTAVTGRIFARLPIAEVAEVQQGATPAPTDGASPAPTDPADADAGATEAPDVPAEGTTQ